MNRDERRNRRRKIAAMLAAGRSPESVAEHFGLTKVMVRGAAREFGVDLPRRKLTPVCTALCVLRNLLDGAGLTEAGKPWGMRPQAVQSVRESAEAAGFALPKLERGRPKRIGGAS